MKKIIVFASCLTLLLACAEKRSVQDKFIDDLMSRMSLEDKIGQLNMLAVKSDIVTGPEVKADIATLLRTNQLGSVLNLRGAEKVRTLQRYAVDSSSLHIPLLCGLDIVHGYFTHMPVPLGIAATWDPFLAEDSARIAAEEGSCDGICWTFAPMLDITHDARWGRVVEGNGEDPYLGARFAEAYVRGFQGDFSGKPDQMMACVKHFAAYGAPFGGLDYTAVDMSRPFLWNYYLEPYKAAIEAGAGSVMSSFNEYEGIPGTANGYLLKDVLREQWGFDGIVVSDYNAVGELREHGLGDDAAVTEMSIEAGLDIDMCSGLFVAKLSDLVHEGKVDMKQVDKACRRVLETKYRLGLFNDPYRFCRPEERDSIIFSPEHLETAKKVAQESFVLLKNKGGILPLRKDANVALIGPYAEQTTNMLGPWTVIKNATATRLKSLGEAFGQISLGRVDVAPGCDICYDEDVQKYWSWYMPITRLERSVAANEAKALRAAKNADVIIAAMGEPAMRTGEGASVTDIRIPDAQRDLLEKLVATGKPVVLVLFTGRPLDLSWEAENVDAILNVWFPGSMASDAIAGTLYGEVSPSGKLPITFPRSVGQLPYYYNHTRSARNVKDGDKQRCRTRYIDNGRSPLYPFGYGLSYTTFEYSDPTVTVDGYTVEVSVTVRNSGQSSGSEVVQLYIRDEVSSESRPICELKGFRKVVLQPGESEAVTFNLNSDALSYYNHNMERVFEPGKFTAMVGGNCQDVKKVAFEIE